MVVKFNQKRNNISLYKHQEAKGELLKTASNLRSFAKGLDNQRALEYLDLLIDGLKGETFHLAVLGNFKRGKSTFINALIGAPILPTGVVPVTSIVTKLCYDDETIAVAHFKGDRTSVVPLTELSAYITENGNPANGKGISEVEIFTNSTYLQNGVLIVDTPGIGSIFKDNTQTTYESLSCLDAAIVVIGGDPPISNEELNFVQEIRKYVDKIYFVQNKIDCQTEDEWREALAFSRSILSPALEMEVKIYPLSARRGLEAKIKGNDDLLEDSGLPTFENELDRFFAVEKGRVLLSSYGTKMKRILSDLRTMIELELRVLDEDEKQLDRKVAWLRDQTRSVEQRMNEIDYLIDGGIDLIGNELDEDLNLLKTSNGLLIHSALEDHIDKLGPNLGPKEYTDAIERFMSEAVVKAYAPFIDKEERALSSSFSALVRRFEKETDIIEQQLKSNVSAMFNIQIHRFPPSSLDLGTRKFRFDRAEMLNYRSIIPAELPFILPKPIFRRGMKKRALNAIGTELDKHGGKVRYDILYRLSENARMVKYQLRDRLSVILCSMNEAVSSGMLMREESNDERQSKKMELAKTRQELEVLWSSVDSIVHGALN